MVRLVDSCSLSNFSASSTSSGGSSQFLFLRSLEWNVWLLCQSDPRLTTRTDESLHPKKTIECHNDHSMNNCDQMLSGKVGLEKVNWSQASSSSSVWWHSRKLVRTTESKDSPSALSAQFFKWACGWRRSLVSGLFFFLLPLLVLLWFISSLDCCTLAGRTSHLNSRTDDSECCESDGV